MIIMFAIIGGSMFCGGLIGFHSGFRKCEEIYEGKGDD